MSDQEATMQFGKHNGTFDRFCFSLPVLLLLGLRPAAVPGPQFSPSDLQEREHIQALLLEAKFDEAEQIVRKCIQRFPEDIYFISQLEMILNAQGKYRQADELNDRVRKLWNEHYKADWIARGSPAAESYSPRVVVLCDEYQVFGTEYFVPKLLGGKNRKDPLALIAYYKIVALPKRQEAPLRVFELDKATIEQGYFLEEYSEGTITLVKVYPNNIPDIRITVKDVISYLGKDKH